MSSEDRIQPIRLTDNDTGITYELDFSRDAIRFAEGRGFKVSEITDFPNTMVPELFFYAFRKNHRKLSKAQTDALLDKMGGLTAEAIGRLVNLYQQAATANVIAIDEDGEKNARVTVEL